MNSSSPTLVDKFGRTVDYVRLSVTDRCDFRCVYCMGEDMQFLPKAKVLTLEEIYRLAESFVALGVKKIRLTGGEPLVRRDILKLVRAIGKLPVELVMTTNGSQLVGMAADLKAAGLARLNISLDSLDAELFSKITGRNQLDKVLAGIDVACATGFDKIKLNTVVMSGRNADEVLDLVDYARNKKIDISFIEEMPLGQISAHNRAEQYCSSDEVREMIEQRYPLLVTAEKTAGPSRYYKMLDSTTRIGFISPHSHNFCSECNRVRVTVEGRLLLCLGNEHSVDLRHIMRAYPADQKRLQQALIEAMDLKPERHEFDLNTDAPQILRFMNMTGG